MLAILLSSLCDLQGQTRASAGSLGGFNLNWDGTWTVATSRDSAGWYAEFRIPFTTLRYGPGEEQTWGLNLVRSIRRKNEESFWSFVPRQFSLMKISHAGTVTGVRVQARRVLTATPYALTGVDLNARRRDEGGGEIKYGVTPSLTLDLTYNTDFAQVEVDEVRTNLTRFPLFFPEKRPFFLENAGIFSAGTPQAVDLFFTRRIGIDTLGQPATIVGGGRLTGRAGDFTVGALQIFTEHQGYSVVRVGHELGTRSRIGVIGVQRMATGNTGDWNRVYGLDGRVGIHDAWTLDWWGAASAEPGPDGDATAYSARLGQETGAWSNVLRIIQVSSDLTTNPSAPLSLDLRLDVGGFYNGTRRGGAATVGVRRGSSLTTSLRIEYNDVRLDQGPFTRTVIVPRVAYFFTPRIMLQTLVQYSNQARVWTANARFGWLR